MSEMLLGKLTPVKDSWRKDLIEIAEIARENGRTEARTEILHLLNTYPAEEVLDKIKEYLGV